MAEQPEEEPKEQPKEGDQDFSRAVARETSRNAIMMLVAFLIVTSFNILYTDRVNTKSDRNWCELIVSLHQRYQDPGITDPDAVKFRGQLGSLRRSLKCPRDNPSPAPTSRSSQ